MTAYMNRNQITTINYNRENIIEAYYNRKKVFGAVTPSGDTYFYASDNFQEYIVPENINKIHVECFASRGYKKVNYNTPKSGNGGKVECDLSVTPGQKLYMMIGNIPSDHSTASYNASDIRTDNTGITDATSLQSRLIVAGGGGNAGNHANGGAGGGLIGGDGETNSTAYAGVGKGGTQTAGGAGGEGFHGSVGHHHNGKQGNLGTGGDGSHETGYEGPSGAGGAGYYGGGGGAGSYNKKGLFTAGGGGGSSYTDSTLCTNVVHTQGINEGDGYIIIKRPDVTLTINPTPSDATVILKSNDTYYGYKNNTTKYLIRNGLQELAVGDTVYDINHVDTGLKITSIGEQGAIYIGPDSIYAWRDSTFDEYTQVGNSITVKAGTSVNYTVSKSEYKTSSGSIIVNDNMNINIILQEETPSGTVIFESSTPGTYTVDIPTTGDYNIWLVGGGSGSSRWNDHELGTFLEIPYSVGGGSGAFIQGTTNIASGTYTIVVGEGGLGNGTGNTGRAGGNTTFLNNIAGGGQAHAVNKVGGGGTYTIASSGLTGTNGNTGSMIRGYKANCGGTSLYNGYGAGGSTLSSYGEYGVAGYAKIVKA